MRLVSILLIFVGTLSAFGTAIACGRGLPVLNTTKSDGTKVGLFITTDQIEATQKWSLDEGEPPLSISAAYQLVDEWAENRYVRYDSVEQRRFSLIHYSCKHVSDRWYYVVDLVPLIDGDEVWGNGNWAAVLMDGTVIGPREYWADKLFKFGSKQ
ncbi:MULTISPECIES: hypothetical protein [unclassified Marinobacter]|nr:MULTISPECIES: hypothetical protein [unclassified Marinobacter]